MQIHSCTQAHSLTLSLTIPHILSNPRTLQQTQPAGFLMTCSTGRMYLAQPAGPPQALASPWVHFFHAQRRHGLPKGTYHTKDGNKRHSAQEMQGDSAEEMDLPCTSCCANVSGGRNMCQAETVSSLQRCGMGNPCYQLSLVASTLMANLGWGGLDGGKACCLKVR